MVVFVHGFIGSPNQFTELADIAYKNKCSVLSILLPGHGGTTNEFIKFRLNDWETHLDNEIHRVSSEYENIFLVGHSIGGLLSLNISITKKYNIKCIMLIASPLKIKYSLTNVITGIKLKIYPKSNNEVLEAYRNSNSVSTSSIFDYIFWLRQGIDVYRLMAKTRQNLSMVTVPITIINSKKDETVSLKSIKIYKKGLNNAEMKIIVLNESRHAYFTSGDKKIISRELLEFFDSNA